MKSVSWKTIIVAMVCTLAVACGSDDGDDEVPNGGDDAGDVGSDIDVGGEDAGQLTDGGDADMDATPPEGPTYPMYGVIEDFEEGYSSYFAWEIGSETEPTMLADEESVGSGDASVTRSGEKIFAFRQGTAEAEVDVREISIASGEFQIDSQLSVPDGNPQDVAWVSGPSTYYATGYSSSSVYAYDVQGERRDDVELDLAQFDVDEQTMTDADPDPSDLWVDGEYVVVLMEMLAGFTGENNSHLAVIDASEDSFVDQDESTEEIDALELTAPNALAGIAATPDGNFAVGMTGAFSTVDMENDEVVTAYDGEIVAVEHDDSGRLTVGPTIVTEEQLGGDLMNFVMTGEEAGMAVVMQVNVDGPPAEYLVKRFEGVGEEATVTDVTEIESSMSAICVTDDFEHVAIGEDSSQAVGFWHYDVADETFVNEEPFGPEASGPECVFGPTEE